MVNVSKIEYLFRPTPIYPLVGPLLRRAALRQWERTRVGPAPLELKAEVIRQYANRYALRTFIETGTFFGDMIASLQNQFDALTTIELDPKLAAKAKERFASKPKIKVVQGDSGQRLPEVIATLNTPALFWLDGHYSGGVTAKANINTPILAELRHLFSAEPRDHVVLIDDARLFGTARDYPSIDKIDNLLKKHRPTLKLRVEMDIIRLEPRP